MNLLEIFELFKNNYPVGMFDEKDIATYSGTKKAKEVIQFAIERNLIKKVPVDAFSDFYYHVLSIDEKIV